MDRLTVDYGKKFSPFRYAMKDGSDAEIGYFKNYDAFYSHMLMVQKLGEYEDLEEQGLLLRLPCKVGDTVYATCTCEAVDTVLDGTLHGSNGGFGTATGYYCPYELNDKCPHTDADDCDECKNIEAVFEDTIDYINITEYEVIIGLRNTNLCVTIDEIGKTVFLTQAEAEQKLKEMESD